MSPNKRKIVPVGSSTGLSGELRAAVAPIWDRLLTHPFVTGMADGSLPPKRYLFYVDQNLLYLSGYARAIALGAARAPDEQTLGTFTDSLVNIVRTEIPQNRRLRDRTRALVPGGHSDLPPEMAPATHAYTSYLLATAALGAALDVRAMILPCAWSYGEIANSLVGRAVEHPVYTEWFRFFASDEYTELVVRMRRDFDDATADVSPTGRQRLAEIFLTATRLEHKFWDMGYRAQQWSDGHDDLEATHEQ